MSMRSWVLGGIGALVLVGISGGNASAQEPTPTPAAAPKSEKADVPACADCHDEQAKAFPANPHSRRYRPEKAVNTVSPNTLCASCHGEGAKHMDSSGEDKSDIRAFRGRKPAEFCTTCHSESSSHSSFRTGMHANSEAVNCTTCHSIHHADAKSPHLTVKAPQALCETCHPTQAATIRSKPFRHRPVPGVMECTSCHDPHGRPGRESLKLTRAGEPPCLTCHSEKRGPFVFEHPPGLSVDSAADCQRCHEPHGSSNPKQLVRARVEQLCLECHSRITANTLGSQPPAIHNISLPRWQNCTTCHVAIHGSNLSPTLFK